MDIKAQLGAPLLPFSRMRKAWHCLYGMFALAGCLFREREWSGRGVSPSCRRVLRASSGFSLSSPWTPGPLFPGIKVQVIRLS